MIIMLPLPPWALHGFLIWIVLGQEGPKPHGAILLQYRQSRHLVPCGQGGGRETPSEPPEWSQRCPLHMVAIMVHVCRLAPLMAWVTSSTTSEMLVKAYISSSPRAPLFLFPPGPSLEPDLAYPDHRGLWSRTPTCLHPPPRASREAHHITWKICQWTVNMTRWVATVCSWGWTCWGTRGPWGDPTIRRTVC